ncbi:MAG: flavin reductase family protein [Treponema sp.]|jgi:flavin reductase (DIM6/NTAB) family NADH-FMN oxidoreductase RutF|nr:flavin reductase family protein [Treponema sp.]
MMRQREAVRAGPEWTEAGIREFSGSPVTRIGDGWMLITAGSVLGPGTGDLPADRGGWNTMTASWGGLGVLWGVETAFCFIRPCRETFRFANEASLFSLSFFDSSHHRALEICGALSGRDTDKAEAAGLTPVVFEDGAGAGALGFREAREVIICQKMYSHDFDPARFILPEEIEQHYPEKDYHRMFAGKILGLRIRR